MSTRVMPSSRRCCSIISGNQEFAPDQGSDLIDGGGNGADDDSVTYWNLLSGVTVNWDDTNTEWHVAGSGWTDTLTDIEWIEGTQGNDSFKGDISGLMDCSFSG